MSTTTPSESPAKTTGRTLPPNHPSEEPYYTELARAATGLFVGVLALMTFLLTVGYQRPHAVFAWALYGSIVGLALNLIAYVFGHMFRVDCRAKHQEIKTATDEGGEVTTGQTAGWERARKRLKTVRLIQQVLFVVAVIAVACLALAAANFFFNIPAPAAGGTTMPQ